MGIIWQHTAYPAPSTGKHKAYTPKNPRALYDYCSLSGTYVNRIQSRRTPLDGLLNLHLISPPNVSTKPWPRTRCQADHRDHLLPEANLIVLNFLPFKFGARQRPLPGRAKNRSKELRVKIRCRPQRSSQMGSPAHLAMKARHCILGLSIPRVSSKAQRVSSPRQKILWVLQFYFGHCQPNSNLRYPATSVLSPKYSLSSLTAMAPKM